ncbi:MAG: hypothetical protein EPO28_15505 [Saprospiraceae bacterium]|nr:MAG: hypothetical protein EPO28_15505 [Saprospiraceae bacterium]
MSKPFRHLRLLPVMAVPLAVAAYSTWYWLLSREQLAAWYKGIFPFFYKAETWESAFFTEAVKLAGNGWCLAALLAAIVWSYFIWKTPAPDLPEIVLKKQPAAVYAGIALVGALLSMIASQHSTYATDEVFSALNFAAVPVFQTLSYYLLPNNHLLFNSINGSLFFWSDDLVLSGRIISLGCYVAVLCFSWHFLQKWVASTGLRFLVLLVVALQFPVWGFSGQARGYELVLLCSCLSLGTFYAYFTTGARYLLPLHTICNVAGILTVPTYLYWWIGLMFASCLLQMTGRRIDRPYLRSSVTGFAACLILHLPLLSFSGLAALAGNKYVQPGNATVWHFLTHLNEHKYFNGVFSEWFCTGSSSAWIGAAFLLLPALLFIYPRKDPKRRVLGVIYFSMAIVFLGMAVLMLKLPFYRNLIAHGYLALLAIVIALAPVCRSKALRISFGLALITFAGHSAYRNYHWMPGNLYYYDVSAYFNKVSEFKTDFKPSSSIYLDDDCFYWWYVLRKKYPNRELLIELNRPRFNLQDYCVMPRDSLPLAGTGLYQLVEIGSEHQIFEKRN